MLENRYEYRRRVVPQEPITWDNFIARHQSTHILATDPSGKEEFRAVELPKEVISTDLKYQIFEKPTQNLLSFLQRHNVSSPSDNIINRLMVVNNRDYHLIYIADNPTPESNALGVRLSNRLCIANADAIRDQASRHKVSFEDLLCIVGTHEIIHTLAYQERWIRLLNTPDGTVTVEDVRNIRREGVFTNRPVSFPPGHSHSRREPWSLGMLAEYIIHYITEANLPTEQKEHHRKFDFYPETTKSLDALITEIGERPFIQATFTREGFRDLYKAIETRYGNGQFRTLLQTLDNGSLQPLPLHERLRVQGFIL